MSYDKFTTLYKINFLFAWLALHIDRLSELKWRALEGEEEYIQ